MAGTAEGAARARERQRLKREGLLPEQPSRADAQPDAGPVVPDDADDRLMPVMRQSNQAVDPMAALLPDSVDVVGRAIRGQIRVPAAVRVSAALRIIELAQKPGGQGAAVPPGVEGALAALGKAFALRQRTLDASDARVVSVVPDPSPQS